MTTNNLHPTETRLLGWYALRWAHITDWFKISSRNWRAPHQTYRAPQSQPPVTPGVVAAVPPSPGATEQAKFEGQAEAKKLAEEAKLKEVVEESQNILIQTTTVFPFTPFPTKLTIDRHKLTIVYRKFFGMEQRVSVPIEDIKNIQADVGPFFGSVTITSDLFINNTQRVEHLRRSDVKKVQTLVQGAMVALKENINISKINTAQLIELLTSLGEGHTEGLTLLS